MHYYELIDWVRLHRFNGTTYGSGILFYLIKNKLDAYEVIWKLFTYYNAWELNPWQWA